MSQELADKRSKEAQDAIEAIKTILLRRVISTDTGLNFDLLKKIEEFDIPIPFKHPDPELPQLTDVPREPKISDDNYKLQSPLLNTGYKLIFRRDITKRNQNKFNIDYQSWSNHNKKVVLQNLQIMNEYEQKKKDIDFQYVLDLQNWETKKYFHESLAKWHKKDILSFKLNYLSRTEDGIRRYIETILYLSKYPEIFPKMFEVFYKSLNNLVLIEYQLPSIDDFPRVKEVKYIASKFMYKESFLSDSELKKLYDDVLYQISLRTLYEVFKSDSIGAVQQCVFNGWVKSIDKATGYEISPCIMSIQANKEIFLNLNLSNVDAKVCFRKLKGISASKLYTLSAIAPVMQFDRNDKRFVDARDIFDNLQEGDNLAMMDWEEFEHLIREVFEKEFTAAGGEVRVTQASRDGGVDAIAFDPDPIRGGKIVIQAKRYTNTVGVSAVRDLFGSLMNEGANKGILVTTSDYGSDAYEFAKGKPITLLNGNNLLHLLAKHGHKARIDLDEAKKMTNTEGETP